MFRVGVQAMVLRRGMAMLQASELRKKMVIHHKDALWKVLKTANTRTGARGAAYVQVDLADVVKGGRITERFRSSEKVDRVQLDQSKYQFLYAEGNTLFLMEPTTFEQLQVDSSALDFPAEYLQEGGEVQVERFEANVLSITPANPTMVCKVVSCDAMRGDTVARSSKGAVLDNGRRVLVPPFVEVGDRVEIKVESDEYVGRA